MFMSLGGNSMTYFSRTICLFSIIVLENACKADGDIARAEVTRQYEYFLQRSDIDRSGALSLTEWKRATALPPEQQLEDFIIREFEINDLNGDGSLSLPELLTRPLFNFDCMDTDRNGILSKKETRLYDKSAETARDCTPLHNFYPENVRLRHAGSRTLRDI
jgi:hypothetical protein